MNIKIHHMSLKFLLFSVLMIGLSMSNIVKAQKYILDIYELPFNTNKSEFGPAFYKGGIAFIREGGKSFYKSENSNKRKEQTDVFYSLPGSGDSNWLKAKKFDILVNTEFDETSIRFFNEGRNYLVTRNNIDEETREKLIREKISKGLYSKNEKEREKEIRDDRKFTKLSLVGGRSSNSIGSVAQIQDLDINSLDYAVSDPAISPDNKTLIVSSDKPGGQGNYDLYMYKREKGKWVDMKPLSSLINSSGNEVTPFILDYYTMFYASDKRGKDSNGANYGGLDIFRVDGWNTSRPRVVRLPEPINTEFDDFALIMSPSNKFGYFSSNRLSANGKFNSKKNFNIYKYIHIAKTMEVILVDADNKPMVNKKITLKLTTDKIIGDYFTNEKGKIKISVYQKLDYIFSFLSNKGPVYLLWSAIDPSITKTFKIDEETSPVEDDKKDENPLLAAMRLKKNSQIQMKKNTDVMNERKKIMANNSNSTVLTPINNENFQEIGNPNINGARVTKEQEQEMLATVQNIQKNSANIQEKKIASTSSDDTYNSSDTVGTPSDEDGASSNTDSASSDVASASPNKTPSNEFKNKMKHKSSNPYSRKSAYDNILSSDTDDDSDNGELIKTKSEKLHKLVNKEIKLKEMVRLDGKISDENNVPLENATVIIETLEGEYKSTIERTDPEGVFGANLERFKKYWVSVLHSKDFSVPSYVDASISDNPNIYLRASTVKLKVNDKIPLRNMNYVISKTRLNTGGDVELRAVARFLKLRDNADLKIQINSYTDATGPKWLNLKLSQKRANQAKSRLVRVGVDASRIDAQGRGETNFLNQCVNTIVRCSPKQHAINRRTEIIIK